MSNLDPRWRVTAQLQELGGDPSLFFEIIENIIARQDWLYLTASDQESAPVGTFRRLIQAPPPVGCGLEVARLLKILELPHRYEHRDKDIEERMKALRENVKRLLDEELPALPKHGAIGNGRVDNVNSKTKGGNSPEYALQRLKRDRPDLARKVIDGNLAPNAAAVEAGFRSPKVAVRLDDMHSAAQTLARRLSPEQLDELMTWLREMSRHD